MRFFAAVLMLVLVSLSVCSRRGLVLYPEEVIPKAEDDDQNDSVIVPRVVDFEEKGKVIVDKAADHDEKFSAITDAPGLDDDEKSRVIYPTEDGEIFRGIEKNGIENVPKDQTKIPESLLIAMNNVHSADEFLRLFVARSPDGEIYNKTEFGFFETAKPEILSRKGLSGETSVQVTPLASCQPQKSVVKVENSEGDGVLLWPPCVYLQRCGGCCISELMICRPTATSTVNVTVIQALYTGPQSSPFTNQGVRIIPMEQHQRCACGCKVLPDDCTPLQEYRSNECRCVCSDQNEATRCQQRGNKFWDSQDCVCKCRSTRDCSSGLFFNVKTCRCEALRLSLVSRINMFTPDGNETNAMENESRNNPNNSYRQK